MFELLKAVVAVVGMVVAVGGAVFGTVMFVRKAKEEAKKESNQYADLLLLAMETRHNTERQAIMKQFDSLLDLSKNDVKFIFVRLNDVDIWRKEINGQLKLIGQQSEFTNKILEGQGKHLETLATVSQQLVVSVAELKASLEVSRDEFINTH